MTEPRTRKQSPRDIANESPAAWFAVLERARLTGDLTLAARARHELERLGVLVEFTEAQPA